MVPNLEEFSFGVVRQIFNTEIHVIDYLDYANDLSMLKVGSNCGCIDKSLKSNVPFLLQWLF